MSINEIIIYIMVIFAALGALDRIFGSRFGLGEKFEEGIMAIGALSISMVGIIALAPVIANLLKPVIVPVFGLWGLTRPCLQVLFWRTIWAARLWHRHWH